MNEPNVEDFAAVGARLEAEKNARDAIEKERRRKYALAAEKAINRVFKGIYPRRPFRKSMLLSQESRARVEAMPHE